MTLRVKLKEPVQASVALDSSFAELLRKVVPGEGQDGAVSESSGAVSRAGTRALLHLIHYPFLSPSSASSCASHQGPTSPSIVRDPDITSPVMSESNRAAAGRALSRPQQASLALRANKCTEVLGLTRAVSP